MTDTDTHTWRSNLSDLIEPFSLQDKCTACRVRRYDPMPGELAVRRNAVAAGACPRRPWVELTVAELDTYLASYLLDGDAAEGSA